MTISSYALNSPYRFAVGIDLGTTNSALAYVDLRVDSSARKPIAFMDIPQLVAPGELGRRPVLPSFLYLPGPYELGPSDTALPWDAERAYAVGEFAREQGALVPGRLVSSAKSWLCHGGVDRTAPILPWGASSEVQKISPVEASARYLQHMREAWNELMARNQPENRLEEQLIILTVPASFDEIGRELTLAAARQAGLQRVVLLEEPLAAFYAWLSTHEHQWRQEMCSGQVILVCDVGGGTTDFTLITVRETDKGLKFDRLAVGEHLMLGGDNMDLSLARHIEHQIFGQTGKLDSRRWHQLWHQCRKAKEFLLTPKSSNTDSQRVSSKSVTITIMGSGSRLIGDTLKGELHIDLVQEMILEGFFPFSSLDDLPRTTMRRGLTEWGLPYVQDPAITRHLAAFWQRYRDLLQKETGKQILFPDYILFNGGALTPDAVRERIVQVVQSWFRNEAGREWKPIQLINPRPDLAVAIGAAYYGLVRLGTGIRVGSGSPRSYYVEVSPSVKETAEDALFKAVCIVPRGTEEGFEATLMEPPFEVLANRPVAFQLFTSFTRLGDRLGNLVELREEEITGLPPIRTVLRYGKKSSAQSLPVQLSVKLTEVGTLELWCNSLHTPHRWQLQFDVREQGQSPKQPSIPAGETLEVGFTEAAQERVRKVFCQNTPAAGPPPEKLVRDLISALDLPKDRWPTHLIRKISDALLECQNGRSLSPHHESRWLNLLGFCMRPGFGDPLDEWRMKEVWKTYPLGLSFPRQAQCRSEWWVFWRRVAGGLSAGQQWHIYQNLTLVLSAGDKSKKKPGKKTLKPLGGQEQLEIWMALANFEYLPSQTKVELGRQILQKIKKGKPKPQELWALGRLGARTPFYGPLDLVIPNREAASWIKTLLSLNLEPTDGFAQTLIQLGRKTGDRERDLSQEEMNSIISWLTKTQQASRYQELLTQPEMPLFSREQDWVFGESLPPGLIISGASTTSSE